MERRRHIKLVEDLIAGTPSEDRLQDTMMVVLDNRRKVSKHAAKQDLKKVQIKKLWTARITNLFNKKISNSYTP